MLSYLSIKNFGLFADASLDLDAGLTVFTGETGAGKSMIVDAVMACLGQRTSKDLIRQGEEKAIIELLALQPSEDGSSCGEQEVILRKEVLQDRSYLRINGQLATSAAAQEIGGDLVDIHGQQEHHSLLRPQTYLNLIDSLERDSTRPLGQLWTEHLAKRNSLRGQMDELGKGGRGRKQEIDLLTYQVEEIVRAKIRSGEEQELRDEYLVLSSQETLSEMASTVYESLYGGSQAASGGLDRAISVLRKIAEIDSSAAPALDLAQEISFNLEAAIDLVRDYRKRLVFDPDRLRVISERLDLLGRLKSKYGESEEQIIAFAEQAEARLNLLINADERLAVLRAEMDAIEKEMSLVGRRLTECRRGIAQIMTEKVTDSLQELGMAGARFVAQVVAETGAGSHGFDRVDFLFSANPGESLMPVSKVASGGELSRLMLAIKSHMEDVDPVPTVIFDEIDAGIGGQAGQKVAERLWRLGRTHQILCVTHLASIAALADHHFLVFKQEADGRTVASVRKACGEERVLEIARMLSSIDHKISSEHAKWLLKAGEDFKK